MYARVRFVVSRAAFIGYIVLTILPSTLLRPVWAVACSC